MKDSLAETTLWLLAFALAITTNLFVLMMIADRAAAEKDSNHARITITIER